MFQPHTLAARDRDFVERGDRVPCTQFSRIDLIVSEILPKEFPVLVTDEPVFGDDGRVKLDLD